MVAGNCCPAGHDSGTNGSVNDDRYGYCSGADGYSELDSDQRRQRNANTRLRPGQQHNGQPAGQPGKHDHLHADGHRSRRYGNCQCNGYGSHRALHYGHDGLDGQTKSKLRPNRVRNALRQQTVRTDCYGKLSIWKPAWQLPNPAFRRQLGGTAVYVAHADQPDASKRQGWGIHAQSN